jgi:hypothetical protein
LVCVFKPGTDLFYGFIWRALPGYARRLRRGVRPLQCVLQQIWQLDQNIAGIEEKLHRMTKLVPGCYGDSSQIAFALTTLPEPYFDSTGLELGAKNAGEGLQRMGRRR